MSNLENRKYPRVPIREHLKITDMAGKVLCNAITLNVSQGGIGVLCEKELQHDVSYKLIFDLEYEQENICISALSKLVYQHPDSGIFKIGFEFHHPQDFTEIKNWIERIRKA